MSIFGAGARRRQRKPSVSIAQRAINDSKLFTRLKDVTAGYGAAPKWKGRYKLLGTDYIFYVLAMDVIRIREGSKGPFLDPAKVHAKVSKDAQKLIKKLGLI